jgi:hypothetical protein
MDSRAHELWKRFQHSRLVWPVADVLAYYWRLAKITLRPTTATARWFGVTQAVITLAGTVLGTILVREKVDVTTLEIAGIVIGFLVGIPSALESAAWPPFG